MKKRTAIRALALILTLVLLTTPALAANSDVAEARSGVVRVIAIFDEYYSTGSGFGVGEVGEETTTFVTNRHVLIGEDGERPLKIYILLDDYAFTQTGIDESRAMPCSILWVSNGDPDLAVLETPQPVPGRVAMPLCEDVEDRMEPTDDLWVLGFPASGDYISIVSDNEFTTPADIDSVSTSAGIFSKFEREASSGTRVLVHTAGMNGGCSGGPTVNEDGVVIGVNTFVFGNLGDTSETAHSASISVTEVIAMLDDLDVYWEGPSGSLVWLFILLGVLVLAAAAAAVYFLVLKKQPVKAPVAPNAAPIPAAPRPAPAPAGDSGLRFQAVSGTFAGKRFAINGTVRMGRNPGSNDFVYPTETQGISGNHCSLIYTEGRLFLRDEGSSFGTFLGNGQRLAAHQSAELRVGDTFYLATTAETFVITRKGGI